MVHNRNTLGLRIALFVLLSLAGCADDSAPNNSVPSVGSGSSAGSPSPRAASSGTTSTSGPDDYTAVIDVNSKRNVLSAGRYALAPIGPSSGPLAVVDVPEGFLNDGPFLFPVGEDAAGEHAAVSRAIGYWTVTGVYKDPCLKNAEAADPGPGAKDLALALTAQRGTETTDPTPVTLDGYDGLYMELTAPTRLDYATCRFKTFDYWVSDPVGGAYTDQPGLVTRLWIIDVNDDRVVIAVAAGPHVYTADIHEVTNIAESTSFVVH